jgi:hypothetical protein
MCAGSGQNHGLHDDDVLELWRHVDSAVNVNVSKKHGVSTFGVETLAPTDEPKPTTSLITLTAVIT